MTYNGNRRLGDLFASRREKGHAGLPTLSVTLNSGLVNRQELDRKQDTALSPHEHLLVRSNDIVYNMMRMWQGAFGLADREGIVSPAYVVLRPKADIDPRYAAYLFKTPRMTYLFWAYSYGLTEDRLRLYFSDFAKIPVAVPSIAAQRRCAAALCSVQELLNIQRKLVTNSFATKAAVLRRLLHPNSEQLKSGWTEIEFGDLVDLVKKQFDPGAPSATTRACIELEHVEATTGVLLGTVATSNTSSTKLEFQPNDVLFGKLRPYLRKYWLAARSGRSCPGCTTPTPTAHQAAT